MEIAIGKTNHTFDKGIHNKSILWGIYPAFLEIGIKWAAGRTAIIPIHRRKMVWWLPGKENPLAENKTMLSLLAYG